MPYGNSTYPFFLATFHYNPSVVVAAIALGGYTIITIISLVLTRRYGRGFMYIIPAMGLMEMLGYATRIVVAKQETLNPYIASALFILLPPIALALVNYIVAGRMLRVANKAVRVIFWEVSADRVAKVFFWTDVACFFLQASGSSLLAVGNVQVSNIGTAIVVLGLSIQFAFIVAYIWVLHRISTDPFFGLSEVQALKYVFVGLRITVFFLFVRNIYRIAEYATGFQGPIQTTEWTMYVFETLTIFLCFITYCVFHFGRLLQNGNPHPQWIVEYELIKSGGKEPIVATARVDKGDDSVPEEGSA